MAGTLRLRKSVDGMTPVELTALRDAYAKMFAIRNDDPRSWFHWAGVHVYPQGQCWHHGRIFNGFNNYPYDLFLPWHRAYLITFENTVIDQNGGASLPWWDWTKGRIPDAFNHATAHGRPNPLYQAPGPEVPGRRAAGPTRRFPGQQAPAPLPTKAQVDDLV